MTIDYKAEYDALKDFLTANRGWDTAGLDLVFYDGWHVYCGLRCLPLRRDGTVDFAQNAIPVAFSSAAQAVAAIKTFAAQRGNKRGERRC